MHGFPPFGLLATAKWLLFPFPRSKLGDRRSYNMHLTANQLPQDDLCCLLHAFSWQALPGGRTTEQRGNPINLVRCERVKCNAMEPLCDVMTSFGWVPKTNFAKPPTDRPTAAVTFIFHEAPSADCNSSSGLTLLLLSYIIPV